MGNARHIGARHPYPRWWTGGTLHGSSPGSTCAQTHTRILILEKAHYPRPKLCAGGLLADAEIILDRLGLDVSEVPMLTHPRYIWISPVPD